MKLFETPHSLLSIDGDERTVEKKTFMIQIICIMRGLSRRVGEGEAHILGPRSTSFSAYVRPLTPLWEGCGNEPIFEGRQRTNTPQVHHAY